MENVVISPHPDDAVWSCGGALAAWVAAGRSVTVVTVFDGDGAEVIESARGDATPMGTPAQARRAEDVAALAACGVRRIGLGFVEAAMRVDAGGAPLYRGPLALRRRPHQSDEALVPQIARALAPYARAASAVFAPLGVGTHVDHELARRASERVAEPARLRYYREFPYAPPPPTDLTRHDWPVDFSAWLRHGLAYRSQVESMFGGALPFARALWRHAGRSRPGWWQEWRAVAAGTTTCRRGMRRCSPAGTAVDRDGLPGDVSGAGAGKERHGGSDLGRAA